MDILAALRQEEAKWEKEVSAAKQQLDNVRAAMKLLGGMGSSGKATVSSGSKTTGAWREETGDVCRCESEDFEGIKRPLGKV